MNHSGSSGVGAPGESLSRSERDSVDRAVEENAERFARALLPHVAPQAPPRASGPTGGWRGGDGVLTQGRAAQAPHAAHGAQAQDGTDESAERVVVRVQSADLGELSLVLDRSAAGVRVRIGVADARAAELMAPERDALMARLVGNGVRVQSVQIIGQRELGTLLAPPRTVGSPRAFGSRERVESESDSKTPRRGSRKLDVIG